MGAVCGFLIAAGIAWSRDRHRGKRIQRERELVTARDWLRHVVSSSPTVLYTLKVKGGTHSPSWVSENIESVIGYRADEVSDASWWETHLHPDDRDRLLLEVPALLEKGHLEREYRLRRKDGTYAWVQDEQRLIRDEAGKPTEVIGSWWDVTVRKSAERRLLESEAEYRVLFDSNPHSMWVFDAETLAFLAVNDAAVRLYGFSRSEFLGMTIEAIRPEKEVPALLAYLAIIPDSPSLQAMHVKHRKKDGSLLEVEGVSNPIEFQGRKARLVLATDVTEKRELEVRLQQSQKMEAVGRLAGGVAHDFNNLLGVITGYCELLLKSLDPTDVVSKRVAEIQKAAERAAGLTLQLLAFSRKQVLQPRILDLNEVVANVGDMLRRLIHEDIHLVITPGAELGCVLADPGQIEQVLVNLVVNARDAMPKGGGLILETANVTLDDAYARAHPEVAPGPFVMLSVKDTGEGMDPETQAHIFEPFFTTKAGAKGTGLGLATVFGIVHQSGGSVSFDSEPGLGTTCTIYLPRVEGALPQPSGMPKGGPPPRGTETLLLVEDADSLRGMVREMLENAGYTVLESADPEEALFKVSTWNAPLHLMLTDVVMPSMSGPDLATSVRIAKPGIKVVFMSGYTDEALGVHGVLDHDTQFIQKPFSSDDLLRKIREAIDEP